MRGHKLLSITEDRKVILKQLERRAKREQMSHSELIFLMIEFALNNWRLFKAFSQGEIEDKSVLGKYFKNLK